MQVEDAVASGNGGIVARVDDWVFRLEIIDRVISPTKVIGTDSDHFRVLSFDGLIVVCQIDELAAAERSPECPVEDQHKVLIWLKRCQLNHFFTGRLRECEIDQRRAEFGRIRLCFGIGRRRGNT